jgi:hypothetical protein
MFKFMCRKLSVERQISDNSEMLPRRLPERDPRTRIRNGGHDLPETGRGVYMSKYSHRKIKINLLYIIVNTGIFNL